MIFREQISRIKCENEENLKEIIWVSEEMKKRQQLKLENKNVERLIKTLNQFFMEFFTASNQLREKVLKPFRKKIWNVSKKIVLLGCRFFGCIILTSF